MTHYGPLLLEGAGYRLQLSLDGGRSKTDELLLNINFGLIAFGSFPERMKTKTDCFKQKSKRCDRDLVSTHFI